MPRPIFFAARSGRFVNPGAGDVKIVCKNVGEAVYRIHNTSKDDPLNIKVQKNTELKATHELAIGESFDLTVDNGEDLYVVGKGKGVYDLLKGGGAVRSGSFAVVATTTVTIPIANLRSKSCLYRIINSGDKATSMIQINNGTALVATLGPESSIDLVLDDKVTVTSGGSIEGVFDLLGEV